MGRLELAGGDWSGEEADSRPTRLPRLQSSSMGATSERESYTVN